MEQLTDTSINRLTKKRGSPDLRPFIFLNDTGTDADTLSRRLNACVNIGVGGIIPLPLKMRGDKSDNYADELLRFREFYTRLLPEAAKLGLRIAFTLAPCIEYAVIKSREDLWDTAVRSRVLTARTYYCMPEEKVNLIMHDGNHVSTVAYNEEADEIIDLRGLDTDGVLEWQAPRGNWKIVEYICSPDDSEPRPDVLSYEASQVYIETAYSMFSDLFDMYPGTVTHLYYQDLCYASHNRRDWTDNFNEVFKERFGFDPAPFYPYLFTYSGTYAPHYKALFSDCRARMLRDGFLLASEMFCAAHGLELFSSIAEPKLTSCAPITGDALLDNTACPCAVFERSYLYGMNSVKLAAGAAFGRSIRDIFVELYRSYPSYPPEVLLRDASHAFARGANLPAMHMPPVNDSNREKLHRLYEYTASVRSCLSRGHQVSDIAVIYPIYYLHSQINLYDTDIQGFEYPDTPDNADYMTVINSICLYSGHDVTLLHPDVVARSARAENGLLRLTGLSDEGGFKVVVFPAQKMCSLECMSVLKDYFDAGGKIIATGKLPVQAFEFDSKNKEKYDKELKKIVDHIFGGSADNPAVMREYFYNRGENGGEAYFLPFDLTSADGTYMVNSHTIARALNSFNVCYDIYAPEMAKYESTGALNTPYREFVRLGLRRHLPDGGMFSHIHKRHGNFDIYFFTNTTDRTVSTPVFLKGAHDPYFYDPLHEKKWKPDYETISIRGAVYTRIGIELLRSNSLIIVSENAEEREKEVVIGQLHDCTAEAGIKK